MSPGPKTGSPAIRELRTVRELRTKPVCFTTTSHAVYINITCFCSLNFFKKPMW